MTNPQKVKGSKAELEVARWLSAETGFDCRRALGAGRQQDVGDIWGLPGVMIEVKNYADFAAGVRSAMSTIHVKKANAGADYAVAFLRRPGGLYLAVQPADDWLAMWREAVA